MSEALVARLDRDSKRRAALPTLITFAVALVCSTTYGFHRDELYIVATGRAAQWGSIDHAPLVPAISRVLGLVAGESPFAQRLVAALAGALVVGVTGLFAARIGGGRRTQLCAMAAIAIAPAFLFARGVIGTNVVEQLAWIVVAYVLASIRAGAITALAGSLAIGVTFGIALENKYSALGLLAAFVIALAVVARIGKLGALRSPWLFAIPVVAGALWLPNLLWQHAHGWPALEFHEAHRAARAATASTARLFLEQPIHAHPVTFTLAAIGLVGAIRKPEPVGRALAVASLLYIAVVAVGRGKPYYLAPLYPPLVAIGAVALGDRLARLRAIGIATAATAPLVVVATLPLVDAAPLRAANRELVQFLDWPALVEQLAVHYRAHFPAGDGAILVASYGTAAAIELYGRDLPAPISGANSYFARTPAIPTPEQATRVPYRLLAIGYDESLLRPFFGSVTPIGTLRAGALDNRFDVPRTIYLCRGMKLPLALAWHRFRVFD